MSFPSSGRHRKGFVKRDVGEQHIHPRFAVRAEERAFGCGFDQSPHCALIHAPRLLILDEPFSGLDPVNQGLLEQEILRASQGGAAVVFSTHVMQHAERLCDTVVLLARGRKAFEGTVDQAKATAPRFLDLDGAISADAAAALPGVAGVETLSDVDGVRRLKIALAPGAGGQDTLKTAFLNGLDVRGFALKEPTLHDAFIGLTGDHPDQPASPSEAVQ